MRSTSPTGLPRRPSDDRLTQPFEPTRPAPVPRRLGERFDVDEVMVIPVASAHAGTDPATAPGRVATLELLAKELF
jgi:hypothetical protein